MTVLVIGYGNPGRGDDGLGPEFARRVAARALPGVTVVADFQLKVEHAVCVAEAERVVFADASLACEAPFSFVRCEPASHGTLHSHTIAPEVILALARLHFGSKAQGFVLGIPGQDFGRLHEGLSAQALQNLDRAEAFFIEWLGQERDEERAGQAAQIVGQDIAP